MTDRRTPEQLAETVRDGLRAYWDSPSETESALDALLAHVQDTERRYQNAIEACRACSDVRELMHEAENRAEQALWALAEADRLASVAHDAIWSSEVTGLGGTGFGILHDNDREDSAQSAIWRLHEVVRPLLPAAASGEPPP